MKNTMIKILLTLSMLLILPTATYASFYRLPEVMVGQTKVETGGNEYYGGMTGSEAIVNFDPNFIETDLLGFNEADLIGTVSNRSNCYLLNLAQISDCYKLTPSNSPFSLLTSKTSINGVSILETAALLYPSKIISGDAYSNDDSMADFNFYGRNLYASKDADAANSDATWKEGSYDLNPDAQASYEDEQRDYYVGRIEEITQEASFDQSYAGDLVGSTKWYLQSKRMPSNNSKSNSYPEGKTWRVVPNASESTVTFSDKDYTYHDKGTIIIDGNLRLENGAKIERAIGEEDTLGIIVLGKVEFMGNNIVEAALFSTNRINVLGDNVEMRGSFVAKEYLIGVNRFGIKIFYDFNLENNWPPGFRYFDMPHPENL